MVKMNVENKRKILAISVLSPLQYKVQFLRVTSLLEMSKGLTGAKREI